jgi:hypothetical protein
MDSTEVPAEEDLYVEALEWMEALGADIVSTSLGYVDWYPYDSLNGTTAITTKAARVAASKGVLLVTAMGNEGWFRGPGLTGTMIAPADADSIIAVGASHSDYEIAAFSSTGPTADGRTKPDVMAQGVGVIAASGSGTTGYISAQGTSLSTPLVAGAAALLLSSQPELTPMQVREAILQTAYRYSDPFNPARTATYPNNYYGHGVLDAYKALLYHGIAIGNRPKVVVTDTVSTSVYISIASNAVLAADSLSLLYQVAGGAPFQRISLTPTPVTNLYRGLIPAQLDSAWRGYFSARDQDGRTRLAPYNAPDSLFILSEYVVSDIPGITPQEFQLLPNYPNPFNAGTTISFDAPGVQPVELLVFDILGRIIKTLYSGNSVAGRNVFRWDGTDDGGRSVSTGVYISRLRSGTSIHSQKILLIR